MWLDNVFVPNNRLFFLDANVDPIARWLFWHQLYCWLSKGDFALGLGLALTDAMGLVQQTPTVEMLVDMIADVQTVRTCITAAELDPSFTPEGYCYPNHVHTSVGSLAMLNARQRLTEDAAHFARFVDDRGAVGHRSRLTRGRTGVGTILRRRRLYGAAARGFAANGVGSCRVVARRTRIDL